MIIELVVTNKVNGFSYTTNLYAGIIPALLPVVYIAL